MNATRKTGILYLLVAVLSPFTMLYVPSLLFVANDAAATAKNIVHHEMLFRVSIAMGTGVFIAEILLTAYVFRLFKPVNGTLSLAAAFARLSMTTIQGLNIVFRLLTLASIEIRDNALVDLTLRAHDFGVVAWQIFFGLHLIILGYLAIKSGFIPKPLGYLLILGSFGYLADSYVGILAPSSEIGASIVSVLLIFSTLGEVAFMLWLLIKGRLPAAPSAA